MRYRPLSSVPYGERAVDLLRIAQSALLSAYAPYSKFRVGAALLAEEDPYIFSGCNVESADYDGTHAEESALCRMVSSGQRTPLMLAVAGGLEDGPVFNVMPCGKCRQKLWEFCSLSGYDLDLVIMPGKPRDIRLHPPTLANLRLCKLSKLLPKSFGPADIGVDLKKYRW